MKIVLLNGSTPGTKNATANEVVTETLAELGFSPSETNVLLMNVSGFDGFENDAVSALAKELKAADGVILSAFLSSPCLNAPLLNLLEHLTNDTYENPLSGKNCALLFVGKEEYCNDALYLFGKVLKKFGAFDSVRIVVYESDISPETNVIIEKQAEDFYRTVRQNRKFFVKPKDSLFDYQTNSKQALQIQPNRIKPKLADIYESLNLEEFDEQQKDDIEEIAAFLSGKFDETEQTFKKSSGINSIKEEFLERQKPAQPRPKTCAQLVASLPHHFQPHISSVEDETLQFSVTGAETFSGYIEIRGAECDYKEGTAQTADITIISDAAVLTNILNGKLTAQKAFMIGQIKVRGNFVILTKFEQIFKLN